MSHQHTCEDCDKDFPCDRLVTDSETPVCEMEQDGSIRCPDCSDTANERAYEAQQEARMSGPTRRELDSHQTYELMRERRRW